LNAIAVIVLAISLFVAVPRWIAPPASSP